MTFALEDNKKVEIGAVLAPISTFCYLQGMIVI